MNTNVVAKHYDKLTPWERLPLILAASARGDEAERDRLTRTATRVGITVPDYHGLADGVGRLALYHVLQLLELAATFWEFKGQLDTFAQVSDETEENDARLERMLRNLQWGAYLFVCQFDGWHRFCTESKIHRERLLTIIPGYQTVLRTEPPARVIAFTPEEAGAWVHEKGGKVDQLMTVERVAADMREYVKWHAEWRA